jgi:hypothetical protein
MGATLQSSPFLYVFYYKILQILAKKLGAYLLFFVTLQRRKMKKTA